ncbi:MAG: hypothetical protein II086_09025, partial [Ruminococcus sp.]|nr:hypothetical protein [Ruminococcus sp.]
MKNILKRSLVLLFTLALLFSATGQLSGCSDLSLRQRATQTSETGQNETEYSLINIPISRNGVELHLDCMTVKDSSPQKNILLTHGVTYSSHEFDVDYKDYSLARRLAREGYAVWRLDIAGFG